MSKAHDLAWAAGFFDGEGFVTIQRRSYRGYKSHYLRVGINHVNPEPLYKFQKLFGGTVRAQNPDKVVGNRKQRHSWSTSCKKAKEALIQMAPYFVNKNEVASLGIDLQNSISGSTSPTPEELYNYRESIKQEIMRLNALD